MNNITRLLVASLSLPACALSAPWPPTNASDLLGRAACDFPPEARAGFYSVSVSGHPGYWFHYRHKGESAQFVMLIKGSSSDACEGRIVGALKLPTFAERDKDAKDESRWAVEFPCRTLGENWETNRPAIGIMDQELPAGYFQPREAWTVDLEEGLFVKTPPNTVVCARFNDSGD